MKKTYKILGLVLLAFIGVTSCDKDIEQFQATNVSNSILVEADISAIELDDTNPGNPAVTLNWTDADYGVQTNISYVVEVASDDAFTNAMVVGTTTGNSFSWTVGQLNATSAQIGLAPFEFNPLYVRVKSSVGTQNGLQSYSNMIVLSVKSYYNYPFKDFYLVGNGTSADWNNDNNNVPLFRNADNSNLYTYTGFFTKGGGDFGDGRFKILENRGSWQPQWGTTLTEPNDTIETSGAIAANPTTQSSDPGRFGVLSSGYYTFTINFSSRTYSMAEFDASGATDYTSMTLQGSSLTENTAMTQLGFDSHMWYINSINLLPGEVSFLTNTGASWGSDSSFSGVATDGGAAIPVIVRDNYEVWFNDLTGDYILIPLTL